MTVEGNTDNRGRLLDFYIETELLQQGVDYANRGGRLTKREIIATEDFYSRGGYQKQTIVTMGTTAIKEDYYCREGTMTV